MSNDVAIIGVGLHPFGRFPGKSAIEMGAAAARLAMKDANVEWRDVQFAFGGSYEVDNPDSVVNQLGLTGIRGAPGRRELRPGARQLPQVPRGARGPAAGQRRRAERVRVCDQHPGRAGAQGTLVRGGTRELSPAERAIPPYDLYKHYIKDNPLPGPEAADDARFAYPSAASVLGSAHWRSSSERARAGRARRRARRVPRAPRPRRTPVRAHRGRAPA